MYILPLCLVHIKLVMLTYDDKVNQQNVVSFLLAASCASSLVREMTSPQLVWPRAVQYVTCPVCELAYQQVVQ